MKFSKTIIFALTTSTFLTSLSWAAFNTECLDKASGWIYQNSSANRSESSKKALEFCSAGGDVTCLEEAKKWIYQNTSKNGNDSGITAVEFCRYGDVACLQPTKEWIYKNTSANLSQSSEQAIQSCGQQKRCQP